MSTGDDLIPDVIDGCGGGGGGGGGHGNDGLEIIHGGTYIYLSHKKSYL